MTEAILNLSCYKFTPLDDLEARRQALLDACRAQAVKGTILLAPEGINFFLAGTRAQLAAVLEVLRTLPGLADLAPKAIEADRPGALEPLHPQTQVWLGCFDREMEVIPHDREGMQAPEEPIARFE